MYFDKDAFLNAERANASFPDEYRNILELDLYSLNQHEIHRQLSRDGNHIRSEYFLGVLRKIVSHIKEVLEYNSQDTGQSTKDQELKETLLEEIENSVPRHMKG